MTDLSDLRRATERCYTIADAWRRTELPFPSMCDDDTDLSDARTAMERRTRRLKESIAAQAVASGMDYLRDLCDAATVKDGIVKSVRRAALGIEER